jgi:anti-sigma factor RsiW
MRHLSDAILNGYADGDLDDVERGRAERHLAECAGCRAAVSATRALMARAGALPRDVAPPPEAWSAVRAAIRARRVVPLDPGATSPGVAGARSRPVWLRWPSLAAAALLLVALSAAVTARLVGGGAPSRQAAAAADPALPAGSTAAIDAQYAAVASSLARALEERRSTLSPETRAVVTRNLAVIDQAIREARDALARDPGNRDLVDILSASYEQKVDLLRRTAELLPRS